MPPPALVRAHRSARDRLSHRRTPVWGGTQLLPGDLEEAVEQHRADRGPPRRGELLAFPVGTVTVLQFVKEIICVTFMVFAIVASVKELGLGL